MKLSPCREYQGVRHRDGYGFPTLNGKKVLLHRWVVEQIEGRTLSSAEQVLHKCDNPPCFLYDHLEIGDHAKNMKDMKERGRAVGGYHPGETNGGGGKLTTAQVLEIRRLSSDGHPRAELAIQFGISGSMVSQIVTRRKWGHV